MRNAMAGQLNVVRMIARSLRMHVHKENVEGQQLLRTMDEAIVKLGGQLEMLTCG